MANHSVLNDIRVLVLDDEPDLRTLYELTLLREGYRVETAGTVAQAWEALGAQQFDIVISDMRLPDGTGTEILNGLKQQSRQERCIVITAYGSAENAVESLKAGAFDYLTKPVDLKQFRTVVASAASQGAASRPATTTSSMPISGSAKAAAATKARTGQHALDRLAGQSAAIHQVKERIVKVARSMAPVLIRGESGTGKELVASALHAASHRAQGPWIAVNCSAIPESLLEAEFFGARKGSYTGSTHDRLGFFQSANGGTLFLDEIGDLPLSMQSKLLRAIQERSVRAIGSNQEEPVDVRIVSATHKDLPEEVQAGRFRQDLFYRLNVIDIYIPPLRDRIQDLPELCATLLKRIAQESGIEPPTLTEGAVAQLCCMALPGNVRELENLLHRAVALSDGGPLELDVGPAYSSPAPLEMSAALSIPAALNTEVPSFVAADQKVSDTLPTDLQGHLDQQEREILVKALKATRFNRTVAAQRLGISLRQIRYRIARLGIDSPNAHEDDEAH